VLWVSIVIGALLVLASLNIASYMTEITVNEARPRRAKSPRVDAGCLKNQHHAATSARIFFSHLR